MFVALDLILLNFHKNKNNRGFQLILFSDFLEIEENGKIVIKIYLGK